MPVDGEQLDEDDAEEEGRRCVEDERQRRQRVVRRLVPPQDLEDAERDGDDDGDERRQPEQEHGLGQLLQDDRRYRLVQLVRVAQIEREDVGDEDAELCPDRLVQSVLTDELIQRLLCRPGAEDDASLGVHPAREQVIQDEGDGTDTDDDDDSLDHDLRHSFL